jgi:hypothetical protein
MIEIPIIKTMIISLLVLCGIYLLGRVIMKAFLDEINRHLNNKFDKFKKKENGEEKNE